MKFFKYLYYRIYTWNLKKWGERDVPQMNAMFGVSFMMFVNLFPIGALLELSGLKIFLRGETPKMELIIILLSLLGLNYFLFVHDGKYRLIAKELRKESPRKRRINTIYIWLYFLLSFAFLCLSAIIVKKYKGLLMER